MLLELSSGKKELRDEIHVSYFVKNRDRKAPRVAFASVIDITTSGLCMEISLIDSDLFMESGGTPFILTRDIEMQIFCRTHPINISVPGSIKWFKRKKDIGTFEDNGNMCVGVIFAFRSNEERKEVLELVRRFKCDTIRCSECGTTVSAEAALCYNCGARVIQKRAFLRKLIFSLLPQTDA
ncbi:MAG: hypothetical protein C4532_07965 [Candidatus Abyssobacteria bacterium SURF_17]|jgi:hypothetical protein|uniref:Putative zinc-ribbon domain-containing protein n=1 Tax=Candidatus Abyssobacteria bacterium SURF_17 TaxID=2093361 RepID=A0A419F0L8_9BACT|nr:MAG: hypothetical protein C4532_07965 [Candidatus Abyssubacteria bacterium SURF_17]